jgi:acetyl-CoA carboxylase biotin carboxyl carrier protein
LNDKKRLYLHTKHNGFYIKHHNTMTPKDIQEILGFIAASGLEEVVIETEGLKLKTKRNPEIKAAQMLSMPQQMVATAPVVAAPPQVTAPKAEEKPATATAKTEASSQNYVAVKSPMIGTFYRSASPTTPVFVNVGDEVKKGQVVCIIEAMKLFNEIESEVTGRIVKVMIDNASPVEYDQELFLVEHV